MATDKTTLTPDLIGEYRKQFADSQDILNTLDLIEENNGDLKPVASLLALEANLEITRGPDILDQLALQFRNIICDGVAIKGFQQAAIATLAFQGQIPLALAACLLFYVSNFGITKWCDSHKGNTTTQ